jgi:hypothetical protein
METLGYSDRGFEESGYSIRTIDNIEIINVKVILEKNADYNYFYLYPGELYLLNRLFFKFKFA